LDKIAQNDPSITSYEVNFLNVDGQFAREITMCLKDNKHVTSLKLSGVNMDDEGAKYMAALIKMNSSLMQIDLSNNSIGTFILTFKS
jgi:hypothetical protein